MDDNIENYNGIFYSNDKYRNKNLSGVMVSRAFPFNIPVADCWLFKHPLSNQEFNFDVIGLPYEYVKGFKLKHIEVSSYEHIIWV